MMAGGDVVEVETPAGKDTVLFAERPFEYAEGDIAFHGTSGLVRRRRGRISLEIGAQSHLRAAGHVLEPGSARSESSEVP
jgi:hypothetical protein